MDWLNLHTSVLDSEAFVGSEPVDRATWLVLLRYCVGQENSGVIVGARSWGDRRWQQVCRVTRDEVFRECPLWCWKGSDLWVSMFPLEKQHEVQQMRALGRSSSPAKAAAARANGRLGGRPTNRTENPTTEPTETHAEPIEGKGREGKEEEGAPPPIPFNGDSSRVDTASLLAEFGLGTSPKQVGEWRGGLNKVARCRSLEEARAFLRWALSECESQQVEVSYWRHVKALAVEWDSFKRAELWVSA